MQDTRSNEATSNGENSKQKMVRGSVWMTAGSMFSRILGAIYVIPWLAWMGGPHSGANTLYSYGYIPYTIFISIASAGIPSAIAKQVARYNALGEYKTSQKLFRQGLILMTVTGFISFLLMFFGADMIAELTVAGRTDTLFPSSDVAKIIRSLSWALLLIPSMSLLRGYFQGYQNMVPSAVSQMIEQIFRVTFMLATTFVIMRLTTGNVVSAVTASTFAAFVGAIFSFALLLYYWMRQRGQREQELLTSRNEVDFSTFDIFKEMIMTAIPFILVGTAIPIYQQIDQFSFIRIMTGSIGASTKVAEELFGLFNFDANKLIMITISLAIAIAATVLPMITDSFTSRKMKEVRVQIAEALQLFFFVMLPAAAGMFAIAGPLYTMFYGYNAAGEGVVMASSVMSIFLGLFTILASIAQGVNQQRFSVIALFAGIGVKMIVQYPLISMFQGYGMTLATTFGMLVSCLMFLFSLKKGIKLQYRLTIKRTFLVVIFTGQMLLATFATRFALGFVLDEKSRLQAFILVMSCVSVAGVTYVYLVLKTRLADKLLGDRVAGLRRRLRIK